MEPRRFAKCEPLSNARFQTRNAASAPLEADVEITGDPVVSLFITSTHTDGAFFVYLEDVDANGKVTYLTEGELRALHRRVSNEHTKLPVRYHTFLKKDAMPLVPGQVAELKYALQPISVLVKKRTPAACCDRGSRQGYFHSHSSGGHAGDRYATKQWHAFADPITCN